jgi:hypothetical protein
MAEIIQFPSGQGGQSGGDGSGPSMLEQRVAKLEGILERIEQRLAAMEIELKHLPKAADYATLKADIARVDGRLTNIPTTIQMLVMMITVWSVGTGIVFTVLRFAVK